MTATSGDLSLFTHFPYVLNKELVGDLDAGRRKPGWLWVAVRDGRPVARAGWWSRPGDATPLAMDFLDLEPGHHEDAVDLVRTALATVVPDGGTPPQYVRFLPPDWQDRPDVHAEQQERASVLTALGASQLVERLRLEWRPGTPIPAPTGRLVFRKPGGRDELLALMESTMDGTLDAHGRDELTRMTAAEAARQHFDDELARYRSPDSWWRAATTSDGEPVGFVFPAHNGYNPIVAYIGVLPGMRGHGYIDDLLAEGTRILAAEDVPRIRAATDVGNVPMAAAFARAGYVTFERQVDFVWPA